MPAKEPFAPLEFTSVFVLFFFFSLTSVPSAEPDIPEDQDSLIFQMKNE